MTSALILGATGTIGFDVSLAFVSKGYTVYGTTRTQEKADSVLSKNEITPLVLNVRDTEKWKEVANKVDVIVEALSDYSDPTTYRVVLDALKEVVKVNKDVRIIYTSGIWVYGDHKDETVTERSVRSPNDKVKFRTPVENEYRDIGAVIIQPALLYGRGGSLTAAYFNKLVEGNGSISVVGEPSQWKSYIHASDLAKLYVLAAEHAPASSVYLASGHIHKLTDVINAAGRATGHPNPTITFVAPTNLFEQCLALSQRVSSVKATNTFDWHPTQPSLIDAPSQNDKPSPLGDAHHNVDGIMFFASNHKQWQTL
eukprot:gene12238-14339_t